MKDKGYRNRGQVNLGLEEVLNRYNKMAEGAE